MLRLIPMCALVRAAITHVTKQHRGATLVQVRKHLEVTYDAKLDSRKKKLIHTTFKTLIQKGKLLRKGTIYKSTKARAIARAVVPHRRYRRRSRRSRRRGRRHRRRRPQHHHRQHHHHSEHHRRHHHRRRHHKRHHSRRHHHGHHHDWHHHCSRHQRQHVNKIDQQYKYHGENVPVKAPMDTLALGPTPSKLSSEEGLNLSVDGWYIQS